jgi:hypothetical protein
MEGTEATEGMKIDLELYILLSGDPFGKRFPLSPSKTIAIVPSA